MLRLLIGTGVLLMAIGFGAAGWQYWQSLPGAEVAVTEGPAPATAPPAPASGTAASAVPVQRQGWLISASGGLVPQEDVRAYLAQERFAETRMVTVTRQARLSELLVEGETLPQPEYLQVLADIRAPKVADGLCAVLVQSFATHCAVNRARVVEGSVDPVAGTARFRLELAYRLPDRAALPDLAAHVLRSDTAALMLEPGAEGTASAEAALAVALDLGAEACAARAEALLCRVVQVALDWAPDRPVQARARIAWLAPLPKGMFTAPPLTPATGG
ncbi:hypothetical protein [Rhodobacter calidifons]|uniref:DUF4230 domain-containing protein n=1 Tax=Rhodobacter calidifons TaxID=2715277 RepID=A0ABX0G9D0_9RHOB|nr:hypothetical protein [Rhodobacter calidifons]NHB77527.1 hypothetical protein [Rhodobacter calidifons]